MAPIWSGAPRKGHESKKAINLGQRKKRLTFDGVVGNVQATQISQATEVCRQRRQIVGPRRQELGTTGKGKAATGETRVTHTHKKKKKKDDPTWSEGMSQIESGKAVSWLLSTLRRTRLASAPTLSGRLGRELDCRPISRTNTIASTTTASNSRSRRLDLFI